MDQRSNTPILAELRQDRRPLPGMLDVTVTQAADLSVALANAVDVVSQAAAEHSTGILISRIGTDRYIVRAHPGVPYGLIRESYL
jgi:hypothetical protein